MLFQGNIDWFNRTRLALWEEQDPTKNKKRIMATTYLKALFLKLSENERAGIQTTHPSWLLQVDQRYHTSVPATRDTSLHGCVVPSEMTIRLLGVQHVDKNFLEDVDIRVVLETFCEPAMALLALPSQRALAPLMVLRKSWL